MSNSKIETRTFTLRSEDCGAASDPQMLLRGTAASFGVVSKPLNGFREVIQRGAFTKVLASKPDVRCTFNHSADHVLGRTSAGTLTLSQDENGLNFRCQLDKNNSQHRDIYSSVKRGDINECSFAFSLEDGDDDWDSAKDEEGRSYNRRSIRNVSHLHDVAIVTHPAYEGTNVGARALSPTARQALSFEQQIFLRTGKEYVSPQQLQARLVIQQEKINADRIIARANEILLAEARARGEANDCSDAALRRQLARIEERAGGALTVQGPAPRCVAGSMTATREDHERAAVAHSVLAGRCTDSKSASRHYQAMHDHRLCAENNLQQEYASAAIRSCRDSFDEDDEEKDNA